MGFFSELSTVLEIGWQQSHAVPAFLHTWRETGNPLLAIRAYGASAQIDVSTVEDGARTLLVYLHTTAEVLETVSQVAGDVGYHAAGIRAKIASWLGE